MEIKVGQNRPRVLDPEAPPPEPDQSLTGIGAVDRPQDAGPYWTADKAARVFAETGKALSKLYGPDFRLSAVEIDLVGQPAANVLNDYVALPSGPGGDRIANLLALLAVLALLVALRLPSVLEAHDMLPRWAWARRQRERAQRAEGAAESVRTASPPPRNPEPAPFVGPGAGLEPAAAEAPAAGWTGDKWAKFGPTTVGGGDRFVEPRSA